MPQMDYPSDKYEAERKAFTHPIWLDALILGAIAGAAWFLGAAFSPGGLRQLWN